MKNNDQWETEGKRASLVPLRLLPVAITVIFGVLLALPLVVMSMPESVRIPKVQEHDEGDPSESALFSHWSHDQFRCYECHQSIFPQSKLGFTHDDMDKGAYCATCHNGKIAWSVDDDDVECETCHVEK